MFHEIVGLASETKYRQVIIRLGFYVHNKMLLDFKCQKYLFFAKGKPIHAPTKSLQLQHLFAENTKHVILLCHLTNF
jgi:hypothetical protein